MREVTVIPKRGTWDVLVDGEKCGRYKSLEEVAEICRLAQTAKSWPPSSGVEGIRWKCGRWRARVNGSDRTFVWLETAIEEKRKDQKRTERVRKGTKADRKACMRCRWHGVMNSGGSAWPYCAYSLRCGHRSRVALHYARTGTQSLEGFTFGADCTEYEEGRQ